MKMIAWKYRGLNEPDSPKISYINWLTLTNQPMFLFISETKMDYVDVSTKCSFNSPSTYTFG